MTGGYPARCGKCGHLAPSDDALEKHLEDARHLYDADYPLYQAQIRVEHAEESLALSEAQLAEARARLADLEADPPVTCGYESEFGVCCRRRGHLDEGIAHEYAIVEQRPVTIRPPYGASNIAVATFTKPPVDGRAARTAISEELSRVGLGSITGGVGKPTRGGCRYRFAIEVTP